MNLEFNSYHGIALCRIVHADRVKSIKLYPTPSNSSYMINEEIGVFIKYSTNRMTPWRFTFRREHREELHEMFVLLKAVFVALVCRDDGVACLNYRELVAVLGEIGELKDGMQWLTVVRKPREQYRISGSHGGLKHKIADSQFPKRLFTSEAA